MIRAVLAVAIAIVGLGLADAKEVTTRSGDFSISREKNPFGSKDKVIASTIRESNGLALRCIGGELSVAIGTTLNAQRMSEGDFFAVKVRVDENKIEEKVGIALNNMFIELVDGDEIMEQIRLGKDVAFRITSKASSFDMTFPLRGAEKAVGEVLAACK